MEEDNYEHVTVGEGVKERPAYYDTISPSANNNKQGVQGSNVLLKLLISLIVLCAGMFVICLYLVYATLPPPHESLMFGNDVTPLSTSTSSNDGTNAGSTDRVLRDCEDLRRAGRTFSGQYDIALVNGSHVLVSCDMDVDGGGWTLLLRRTDGSLDFDVEWKSYKNGFGNGAEFWLGNDIMHELTSQRQYKLRIDMTSKINGTRFATYDIFHVANETANYQLTVGGYKGNAGDGLTGHSGRQFTTKDQDNDLRNTSNCARAYPGGWWYHRCFAVRLTGLYGQDLGYAKGIDWTPWLGHYNFLDYVDMKIRPVE